MNIMTDERLTKENLLLFAAKFYDNPACSSFHEFEYDLKRLIYLKKLLRKYHKKGELRENLIINHLIVLFNVFGVIPTYRMLFLIITQEHYVALKTFLVYLNYYREDMEKYGIDLSTVQIDEFIVKRLRNL